LLPLSLIPTSGTASALPTHDMSEREAYESVKRDIKHFIESVRAEIPEAGHYLEKHIVMDAEKMTFAYTGDNRLKMTPRLETFTPEEQETLLASLPHLRRP